MSWTIIPEFRLPDEPEALTYIAAVEQADGEPLEPAVKLAINAFIKGCKADGIWNAIKASCILAGARTLAGALQPLMGTAPTNFNFVSGDYNRKTGLVGDGSTKYLNSNRAENADPENNFHISTFVTVPESRTGVKADHLMVTGSTDRGTGIAQRTDNNTYAYARSGYSEFLNVRASVNSLYGCRRSAAGNPINLRVAKANYNRNRDSGALAYGAPVALNYFVFSKNNNGTAADFTNARLAFYSIGESLDLALLDARVTALINAYAAIL